MSYEPVIGFEIHVELKTQSKMFCGCKNDPFGASKPNIYTCPVCLGMPGALPVANRKAVEWTILVGLAFGCEIPLLSKFDRKHYFYPDLPKGYQISQYDQPLCINGKVSVAGGDVRIHRIHLEEDTGKLLHTTVNGAKVSLIDFNRCGVPLAEIVTEPDIKNGDHAKAFLKKVHQMIRYLAVSDADMEKGSMRLEPNISLRPVGAKSLPSYKVEVKNINSFNFVKRAIEYEIDRQTAILTKGEVPAQENRGWNEEKGVTVPQRTKEEAQDYRYFPDPDIPPLRLKKEYIEDIKKRLPRLPDQVYDMFITHYNLPPEYAALASVSPQKADFFEQAIAVAKDLKTGLEPKTIIDWFINKKIDESVTLPAALVKTIVSAKKVVAVSDQELLSVISGVLAAHPQAVADYKKGKEQALMFLMGQTRSKLPKADTKQILEALRTSLRS